MVLRLFLVWSEVVCRGVSDAMSSVWQTVSLTAAARTSLDKNQKRIGWTAVCATHVALEAP